MSSHHFVTASQSTAVLICGPDIEGEILGQLLEWNPLVICLEKEMDRMLSMNTQIDIAVRTEESGSTGLPYTTESWGPGTLIVNLEKVFDDGRAENLAIVGCRSGELDGLLINGAFRRDIPVVFYTGNSRSVTVASGRVFRKWLPRGRRFCIDPMEHAGISGNYMKEGNDLVAASDGWLCIAAAKQLKFQEYL